MAVLWGMSVYDMDIKPVVAKTPLIPRSCLSPGSPEAAVVSPKYPALISTNVT